jgi:hypothetical protein
MHANGGCSGFFLHSLCGFYCLRAQHGRTSLVYAVMGDKTVAIGALIAGGANMFAVDKVRRAKSYVTGRAESAQLCVAVGLAVSV